MFRWIAGVVRRRHKLLVLLWILAFVGALLANQVWPVNDVISFSQAASLPQDTESAQAQRIIEEQFPGGTANSSALLVLEADNGTSDYYREFVADLHAVIVSASTLGSGESQTLVLRRGGSITVDRPIEHLLDPSNATIYAVYESFAYELAAQFSGPVHSQIGFTQLAASIYWGLPANFVAVWSQVPGPMANDTAFSATSDLVNTSFPADTRLWASSFLNGFYQGWRASFFQPALSTAPPDARAEAVIAAALPAFLDSPFSNATFTPDQKLFQLGMLTSFRITNFADPLVVKSYALQVFDQVPVAEPAFFWDLANGTQPGATNEELRRFAQEESLRYDPHLTPLIPPVNVTEFYLGEGGRIVLMSYGFDKEPRYVDGAGRQPITANVFAYRDYVLRVKAAYGATAAVYVTGSAAASVDTEETFGGGAEFLVTIGLVVILITLYFRSAVSPALPILSIAIAIMIANLFVYVVAVYLLTVDFTVTAVLQIVLLATGTDYSIFLVSRYRDERRDGRNREEAVRNAVIWAGESVTTSGGAVLISFAALSLGSFPIVRTMGLTIGFAVTVALGIALTFIPAALVLLGDHVFWPSGKRVATPRVAGKLTVTERYFRGAAQFSMKHAKAVLLAAVLITIPATYIVLTAPPTFDLAEGAPPTESSEGLEAISQAFGYGFIYPTHIVIRFPDPVLLSDGNVSVPRMDALQTLSDEILLREPSVTSVESPTNPQGGAIDYRNLSSAPEAVRIAALVAMGPYIGEDNRTVRIVVVLSDRPFSREAISTIDRLTVVLGDVRASDPELAASAVYLGGVSAILNDVRDNTTRDLRTMALVVIAGLFTVLLFVLGSVLIPIRAILTILLSIAWTMALTIVLFDVVRGLDVIFILPLALFVMAMGLGMDYDIFIITRIREEVAKGSSDPEAIAEATTRTGGIISACGIVMAGAFATLMLNPSPFLQQIGFALAFVILLDSMVVRIYLVPAIMVLAGKYNWWAPGRLQRVRREEKRPPTEGKEPA